MLPLDKVPGLDSTMAAMSPTFGEPAGEDVVLCMQAFTHTFR
jgi:hypothetical protein